MIYRCSVCGIENETQDPYHRPDGKMCGPMEPVKSRRVPLAKRAMRPREWTLQGTDVARLKADLNARIRGDLRRPNVSGVKFTAQELPDRAGYVVTARVLVPVPQPTDPAPEDLVLEVPAAEISPTMISRDQFRAEIKRLIHAGRGKDGIAEDLERHLEKWLMPDVGCPACHLRAHGRSEIFAIENCFECAEARPAWLIRQQGASG